MPDNKTPLQKLDASLTHSTRLSEIPLDLERKPLPCGFPTIEHHEYILQNRGQLIIIAARPGNGKSALSCQIAYNVSKWGRSLFFSLEMTKEALRERLLAVSSGVPIKKLGLPVNQEKIKKAIKDQESYKLDIIDKRGTVSDIIRQTHDEAQRHPIDLVLIDYAGLVGLETSNRAQGISEVAERLKKEVAEKLKVPVILLAQMKRGYEDRYAKARFDYEKAKQYSGSTPNEKLLDIRPAMEDLGESSGLEKHPDVVMFLVRPHLLDPNEPPSLFKVFVVKNRNGEAKDFNLEFTQSLTKFTDHGGSEI